MSKIAVFIDCAEHARSFLRSLYESPTAPQTIVLVACPPRLTQRIGKWVSHRNREQWRASWSQKLFNEVTSAFPARPGTRLVMEIGHSPLPAMSEQLRKTLGYDLKLFDARRPKMGQSYEAIQPGAPAVVNRPLASPLAVTSGICALLALAD